MKKIFEEDRTQTWEKCYVWRVIDIPVGTRPVEVVDFCDAANEDGEIAWISDTEAIVFIPA